MTTFNNAYTFGIANVPNVTLQIGPVSRDYVKCEGNPEKMQEHVMGEARVRYAKQGATDLVLFPIKEENL